MHVHMTLFLGLSPTPPAHTMAARPPRGPETVTATITSSPDPSTPDPAISLLAKPPVPTKVSKV